MEAITFTVGLFLHLDEHLSTIIQSYGTLTYALLFIVVFCETGLVVTPFLPGDSLLFAAGAFAARGDLHYTLLVLLFAIASILGDMLNYSIGASIGKRVFTMNSRFFKREYLMKTERFYEHHGAKTIILARFLPILRTFAPFVAGVGSMTYSTFFLYNIIGGVLWSFFFTTLGYLFGNIPVVQEHFSLAILLVALLAILPGIHAWRRGRGGEIRS